MPHTVFRQTILQTLPDQRGIGTVKMTDQHVNVSPKEPLGFPDKKRRTFISKTDIARLAEIARREQVVVELEADGRLIRLSPIPANENGGIYVARRGGVVL